MQSPTPEQRYPVFAKLRHGALEHTSRLCRLADSCCLRDCLMVARARPDNRKLVKQGARPPDWLKTPIVGYPTVAFPTQWLSAASTGIAPTAGQPSGAHDQRSICGGIPPSWLEIHGSAEHQRISFSIDCQSGATLRSGREGCAGGTAGRSDTAFLRLPESNNSCRCTSTEGNTRAVSASLSERRHMTNAAKTRGERFQGFDVGQISAGKVGNSRCARRRC